MIDIIVQKFFVYRFMRRRKTIHESLTHRDMLLRCRETPK